MEEFHPQARDFFSDEQLQKEKVNFHEMDIGLKSIPVPQPHPFSP